ncbi:hypothetical protein B0T20DRAFT_432675 [Sordaria brevicollis]|uniref:Uncharacterized protein n=1 Tax=Sordaria brevicollis TaxID=83679 RepID=A0AAE0PIS6_SORBR|nr:hypothetical protein B0T20DRAFT_432675 [Sordaria brevicollis]
MAGPNHTTMIYGAEYDSYAMPTTTMSTSRSRSNTTPIHSTTIPSNYTDHIPTSRYQTPAYTSTPVQAQQQPLTTTAFIFHISTLIYSPKPKTSTSPSSVRTTGTNSPNGSDATYSPISPTDSGSITGYTSSGSEAASFRDKTITSRRLHPNPLRQHQIVTYLLPRPSAGETIARLQAVGVPFVIVWEPSSSSSPSALSSQGSGSGSLVGGDEDDLLDNEFTSEEEVASTLTRVLGLKVPICPEKVVGRWTLLRSVAAQSQGSQSQSGGNGGKERKEVEGTLVIGEDEEKCREMARLLGFEASRVVNAEGVERMWERQKKIDDEKKKEEEKKREEREEQEKKDLTLQPQQPKTKEQHLKPGKPTLKLRSRLSCPFDETKFVERLCFSPVDNIDEESSTDGDSIPEKLAELEDKKEEEKEKVDESGQHESPTSPSTSSTPETIQGQYIPVKHRERTVAYVPVSPTSSTSSKKNLEAPVTRITSIIFFSPPSTKTWDRDVRVVSKLCQSQGVEAPRLYIVQRPGDLGRASSPLASSFSSANPSPTFSTTPSESSLDTLTSTASTVFSKASTTSTAESAPSKRQFKLIPSRTTSDWLRDVTTHWRASNPNITEKAKLPYYIIDPLTCALQVLEIGRQRAQSTIWARANLPVHLRQTLRLETLYVVDSGDHPSQLFRNLDRACRNKEERDADLAFQRYLLSLGVDVIPAKRCRRIWMCNVYEVEHSLVQVAEEREVQDASTNAAQKHQRRTSWLKGLITRKGRSASAAGRDQSPRPSTSSSGKKHGHHSNNSNTNLSITSTNVPPIHTPPNVPGGGGIPRSNTMPTTNPNITTPNIPHPNSNPPNPTSPYTNSGIATPIKFYSPSALNMVCTRTRTQKIRDNNAVAATTFLHSNNIECGVKYAINDEHKVCVGWGLEPIWPVAGVDEKWNREGRVERGRGRTGTVGGYGGPV